MSTKSISRFLKATVCLTALAMNNVSLAATAVLTLDATGTISPSPVWQDGSSTPITNVDFDFDGLVAGAAGQNVDSAAATVKLVNALSYPASVDLVRPQTCTIGATNVTNADVHFLNNGSPVTSDSAFNIASNGNQTYALRFAAAGNYGDDSGAVACATPGSLTYTY